MGMPLTTYSVLYSLANDSNDWARNHVEHELSQFGLFAFILFDPATEDGFAECINHKFERIDYLTGQNLLFFAIADPPMGWLEAAKERDYFNILWEPKAVFNFGDTAQTIDPSITVRAVCHRLNIEQEEMPCIIVTPDLALDEFLVLRTSPEVIEHQLTELGMFASQQGPARRRRHLVPNLEHLGVELDSHYDRQRNVRRVKVSLSASLSELISFILVGTDGFQGHNYALRERSLQNVRDALQNLQSDITNMLSHPHDQNDSIDLENVVELKELSAKLISLLSKNPARQLDDDEIPDLSMALLERDSYCMYQTGRRVLDALVNTLPNLQNAFGCDFSPAILSFSKTFEIETTLAYGHLVRRQLGIDLPAYFSRYQPGVRAQYLPNRFQNPRPLDFNRRGKNDRWIAPGIGETRIAFEELQDNFNLGTSLDIMRLINAEWRSIADLRNQAAHTCLQNRDAMRRLLRSFSKLAGDCNYFEKCKVLKDRLRNP